MDLNSNLNSRWSQGAAISGRYLRGRYEGSRLQTAKGEPSDIYLGGIYGFLEPNEMVAKDAGEWQSYDITFDRQEGDLCGIKDHYQWSQQFPELRGEHG